MRSIETPTDRFQHVHAYLVGPLSQSYLLMIIDCFSRWPDAILLGNINADTVANAFVYHWVLNLGVPAVK